MLDYWQSLAGELAAFAAAVIDVAFVAVNAVGVAVAAAFVVVVAAVANAGAVATVVAVAAVAAVVVAAAASAVAVIAGAPFVAGWCLDSQGHTAWKAGHLLATAFQSVFETVVAVAKDLIPFPMAGPLPAEFAYSCRTYSLHSNPSEITKIIRK